MPIPSPLIRDNSSPFKPRIVHQHLISMLVQIALPIRAPASLLIGGVLSNADHTGSPPLSAMARSASPSTLNATNQIPARNPRVISWQHRGCGIVLDPDHLLSWLAIKIQAVPCLCDDIFIRDLLSLPGLLECSCENTLRHGC